MTTYQNELAGVSPISEPALPTESKHDSDIKRDRAKLQRKEAWKLREFNRPMKEFNQPMVDAKEHTQMELQETLKNRDAKIMESLRNCKNITPEEAMNVPYAHYRYAA